MSEEKVVKQKLIQNNTKPTYLTIFPNLQILDAILPYEFKDKYYIRITTWVAVVRGFSTYLIPLLESNVYDVEYKEIGRKESIQRILLNVDKIQKEYIVTDDMVNDLQSFDRSDNGLFKMVY